MPAIPARSTRRALLTLTATAGAAVATNAAPGMAAGRTTNVQGAAGPVGPAGPRGATGATGATGARGSTGTAGATGTTGAQGATGSAGVGGADGPTGPEGTASVIFLNTGGTEHASTSGGRTHVFVECPTGSIVLGATTTRVWDSITVFESGPVGTLPNPRRWETVYNCPRNSFPTGGEHYAICLQMPL